MIKILTGCMLCYFLSVHIIAQSSITNISIHKERSCKYFFSFNGIEDTVMSQYLYNRLIDTDVCHFERAVVDTTKLKSIICFLYKNGLNFPYPYERTHFENYRIELLFGITSKDILHQITDSLLQINENDGLIVLWDNIDFSSITNFEKYKKQVLDSNNIFLLMDLTVISHINGLKYYDIMNKIDSISGFEEQKYNFRLLLNNKNISRDKYIDVIYEGW